MTWRAKTTSIKIGATVCYSAAFLRSTGQMTGDVPFARGKVIGIHGEFCKPETLRAEIEWDTPDLPKRVMLANLSAVTAKGILDR